MLQTLQAPPKKGTLRESALTLLLMRLESIEHARFRALAQIVIDKDKGVEAFEEYMKVAFPYLEGVKRREKNGFIEILKREAGRGPMRVTEVHQTPQHSSRIKRRVTQRNDKIDPKKNDTLYGKIGNTVPLK